MKIRHLSIRNFRGIRELDWALPEMNMLCLIGRGDSTKSTIIEALRRVFHPQWNLGFDDADFYQCVASNLVRIEVVLGDIPDSFRDLANYGHWLCGWSKTELRRHDDPSEGLEDVLRIKLTVGNDLEPQWSVIKHDEDEGVPFRPNDRAKVAVSLIGAISDRHLSWSRGSILSQLTETDNLPSSLAEAGRAAKSALEAIRKDRLHQFDAVANTAEATARALGVIVSSSYRAHLDAESINVRVTGLALHDGDMPLRQLGLGSKRMLTTGLQKQALKKPHITLFDEVEIGLEPHRIARLLSHLKSDTTGQYFMTTHSPVVLRELTVDDLHVVHCRDGKIEVVAANKPAIAESIQGKIRLGAEAFLAPQIIVCEGATEAGFLRGMDAYWTDKGNNSFAYQGVALFDANGANKIKEIAEGLSDLAYKVAVLADSDRPDQFSEADAAALRTKDISVVLWDGAMSIEERIFADLPWTGVMVSFAVARSLHGNDARLLDQIQTQFGDGFGRDHTAWTETPQLRNALGKAAKIGEWFKRQSRAQAWVAEIAPYLDDPAIRATDLIRKLGGLRGWIDRA